MSDLKICNNCGATIEDEQDFCPKCGTRVGMSKCEKCGAEFEGESKICPECLKKQKSLRKKIMIPCIVVAVLVIGFITWGLIISGGSFKQFSKIVSEGHYVCFFGHDYLDPNCKHGYLCKECGYETGEKGDHEWVEASCTEPKTCTVCKLTEGEKLGHTTGLGKCTRCNEYVYDLQSEYIDICEAFVDALSDIDSAIDYYDYGLDSYYSSQTYYKWAARDFRDAASDIQIAINACGNYSEFSKIKTHLQSAKNSISKIEGNYNSLYTYGNQVLDYVEKARTEILKYEYAMDSDDL